MQVIEVIIRLYRGLFVMLRFWIWFFWYQGVIERCYGRKWYVILYCQFMKVDLFNRFLDFYFCIYLIGLEQYFLNWVYELVVGVY